MPPAAADWSLTRRLLRVMIVALGALGIGLGLVGTLLIDRVVDRSFDKLLGASVQEIAGTITVADGDVAMDIPPSAFGMLENNQRDNVYYSVRIGERLLTGYGRLPIADIGNAEPGEQVFTDSDFLGQPVRIAAELLYLPRIVEPIVIQVAQTMHERNELELAILAALYLLEVIFIVLAAVLIWFTLRRSLRPVNDIREELGALQPAAADFSPLQNHNAPAELVGLVTGFNDLLARLEGSVSRMRRFTADASHEMRTPLAVLKTHLAVLRQHIPASGPGADSLADVSNAVSRLESLLTSLTTLAHADEATRSGVTRSRTDMFEVITQVAGDMIPFAASRQVTLSVDAEQPQVLADAEPILAAEILTNLVHNAIAYNRPGGSAEISLVGGAERVTVAVEDDGPGIPPEEFDRIFERFYRLPRDKASPGSGLGLSIVKTLSEVLGATVSLETPPTGQGLKVSVSFWAHDSTMTD